ncbi:MAG: flavodoxin family protein [Lachnospiraceae bacterium]|nr:flavodoxin family protein [Lachnospiraceae bacterium]MCI7191179.1 flavodoxin family protein [Lachnospiraceae bacterium]MDD7629218.1 flavodoxin family protein [Lachnospiraceae bacterium]MDY4118011.1 flavodoxin family protein [Lachnospiraceae bacterium]
MNLIIHDLSKEQWEALAFPLKEETKIIDNSGKIKKCMGCFGCWLKTPGRCVIPDEYQRMGELAAKAEELTIISKCSFGSYSSFVKNVLDRSISYVLPFFEIREGEMHHRKRYDNQFLMRVIFYGSDITEEEKETAKELVKANAVNLHGKVKEVLFVESAEKIGEVFG